MNQLLPNLRLAFLCSFFIAAAALCPGLFANTKQPAAVSPAAQMALEIMALER